MPEKRTTRVRGSKARSPRQLGTRIAHYRQTRSLAKEPALPPRVAVPSFFTLMNLFCGFISLVQAAEGHLQAAAWLILLAAFFDVLDGLMARLARADSEFGIQLDSLSDVVSFGVAPSFLVYHYGLKELGIVGLIVSALPALCGAVRLARYNTESATDAEKPDGFAGLPIPAQAGMIVAFILTFKDPELFTWFELGKLSILIPLVVISSCLMVTTITFYPIPVPTKSYIRTHKPHVIVFGIFLLLMLLFQTLGLFISSMIYAALCVGRAVFLTAREIWNDEPFEAEEFN